MHYVDYDSDSSASLHDGPEEVYDAELMWPPKAKSYCCGSLKPVHKNQQEEVKFTFDVAKCERIFDELYKSGYIKCLHNIPQIEELKNKAYCKWHNIFSHATNDCNVFHQHVQSSINEGRFSPKEMLVDKDPFPVNTLELQNPKADTTKGKNVVIGEKRVITTEQQGFNKRDCHAEKS